MCCFLMSILLVGPRLGILVWWLFNPIYVNTVFQTWIWPLLGFIFLPWSTLGYMAVAPGGIIGFDWIILGLAVMLDVFSYVGGYREKESIPYGEAIP